MLRLSSVTKNFGSLCAVNNMSWSAEANQVIGLLGPNGAGKSTTIKLLTGQLKPDSGVIEFKGKPVEENWINYKKSLGYLPEQTPLYYDMNVVSYLRYIAQLKHIPNDQVDMEVERVINLIHLSEVRHRTIKNLSKGFGQRVGLAQSLLGNPELIILDEPTTALDPRQSNEIREIIKQLGKQHTVIFSTHILSDAEAVCDKLVILNKGNVVAADATFALKQKFKLNLEDIFMRLTQ